MCGGCDCLTGAGGPSTSRRRSTCAVWRVAGGSVGETRRAASVNVSKSAFGIVHGRARKRIRAHSGLPKSAFGHAGRAVARAHAGRAVARAHAGRAVARAHARRAAAPAHARRAAAPAHARRAAAPARAKFSSWTIRSESRLSVGGSAGSPPPRSCVTPAWTARSTNRRQR